FVVKVKKEFGKEEQNFAGGMPLLLMTPKGELVGELSPYMSYDDVLAQLLKTLKKNAAFDAASAEEKAAQDPLERARYLVARQDLDGAEALLKKEKSPEALLLRAKVARFQRDWKKHGKLLDELQKAGLDDDCFVERGWNYLAGDDLARACGAAAKV